MNIIVNGQKRYLHRIVWQNSSIINFRLSMPKNFGWTHAPTSEYNWLIISICFQEGMLLSRGNPPSQKGWMQVTSYTRRLPQHVSPSEMSRERQRMDSLYTSLQKGTCRVDAGTEEQVGEWVPVSLLLNEWQEVLQTLKKDEWSRPFFSPLGVHVVKWTGRKSDDSKIVASSGEESLMWQDIEDELLVSALMASKYGVSDECSEAELERYFNQHRSDYRWELPHFRGAVIQGKDPKEVKKIRKALKKMPYALWKDVIPSLNEQRKGELYVDYGIYQIGSDACVDKLVFGCGDYELKPGKPESYAKDIYSGHSLEIYRT